MHILLVKVQQKILDDKVDELIICLTDGMYVSHLQIAANKVTALPVKNLVKAIALMLEIVAIQKDFTSVFKSMPLEATQLIAGIELPTDDHFAVYKQLKDSLLADGNLCDDVEVHLEIFRKNFPVKRPFFESYFRLWQQMQINKFDPSPRTLERLAYGTLNLLEHLVEQKLLHSAIYHLTDEDENLLLRYNQNRVLRIDELLMEGNLDAEHVTANNTSRRLPCMKCGSYNMLQGYNDGTQNHKQFVAIGYQCNQCGMELFDQKDLLLAGIKPIYAIS